MQLFETDTTGVLKPLPFTFKSEKGSSYSDRQICVVARDTFYYADNVSGGNGKSDGYIFVEQYDWGGNPVVRYKLDDWGRVVSDGKRLYQVCYMYDDPLFLYILPG